jgi:lipopolysaccharide assembly outer membrane protein LptD (OstA)
MLLQAASPSPSPSPEPSPAAGAPALPGVPQLPGAPRPAKEAEPKRIRLRADTQERISKDHFRATGFVDLDTGDLRIQSDVADLYEVERPSGNSGRHVVAQGNVVFLQGDERIASDTVEMDLDTGHGIFHKAIGYVQPGVFIEADTIERVDGEHYQITGGKFSSCQQPNPRWNFSTSRANVHMDDKVVGHDATFRVKGVPIFYLPVFVYPIKEDQRASGLLLPHYGFSNVRGFLFGDGVFWAMGRSFDQTFTVDHYSRIGWGFGHEFRYALDAPSHAQFKTYLFHPFEVTALTTGATTGTATGTTNGNPNGNQYDLDWNALQMLPGDVRATLLVRQYSSTLFQQKFQDNLTQASVRSARTIASLQKSIGSITASLTADSVETFFDQTQRINRHLPTFRLNRFARKIGNSPIVFGFDARAEGLAVGDENRVDSYSRTDLAPTLSIPFGTTYLQVTPTAQYHYTKYGDSLELNEEGGATTTFSGEPIERQFFEGSLELRGPYFSRVFDNPSRFYGEKFKHVIGPEITFRYRTAVDDFERIPKFDGTDQYLGTNQIDYAIVQRILAKRPGPSGKGVPYEFFTWRVGQTYYAQIKDSQNEFDPNYSSSIFGPGGLPDHNSPIRSNMRLRPTNALFTSFDLEYDVNFKQLRTLGLSGGLNTDRVNLLAGLSKADKLDVDPANRVPVRSTLRAAGTAQVWPQHLTVQGALDYDFVQQQRLRLMGGFHYEVQCCGVTAEYLEYDFNARQEKIFRFSIDLANIGSIGNFLGDPTVAPGGYR